MEDGVSAAPWSQDQGQPARRPPRRELRMGFVLDVADFGARPAPLRSDVQRRLPLLVGAMLAACGTGLDTDANSLNIAFDKLHGVINRHGVVNAPARAIYIKDDVLVGVLVLEE